MRPRRLRVTSRAAGRRALVAASVVAGLLGATSVNAGHVLIYRWVDPADQQVRFSDHAPTNVEAEVVVIQEPPPADPDAIARLQAIDAQADRMAREQHKRLMAAQRDAAQAAARGLDCSRARNWLAELNRRPGPRLRLIEVDGTARRMTEEERQARIADVASQIGDFCGNVN